MSRQKPAPTTSGPDYDDVYAFMTSMMQRYPVQLSLVMEPLVSQHGLFLFRITSVMKPRSPAQHTVNATARPEAVIWESRWSEKHLLSQPSLAYRGLWELEIAICEQLEQLEMPLS